MKRALFIILGLAIIGAGGWLAYSILSGDKNTNQTQDQATDQQPEVTEPTTQPEEEAQPDFAFAQPKKSAHYVSNTPEHGSILGEVPSEVVINFDFDLAENSTISVTKDGQEYGTGAVSFAADKLSMRRAISGGVSGGLYTIKYNACWPDGSCHDGQFQFGVRQ